jgi:aminopeptidase N
MAALFAGRAGASPLPNHEVLSLEPHQITLKGIQGMVHSNTLKSSQVRKAGLPPLVVLILLGLASLAVMAQRHERLVDTWRPLHYDVSIALNNQLTEISTAQTQIKAVTLKDNVSAIDLDFGAMTVDSVMVAGQPVRFEQPADRLIVFLARSARNGEKLDITINYHGQPKDGLVLATDRDGKPSATGDNWPNRVHQWIPCLDHPSAKATVSFTVSAPPRDLVVANGKFVSMTRNGDAPTVWRFEESRAIPPYCMVIVVNEGAKIDATEQTVTSLSYYVPQRDRAYAAKGFSSGGAAVALFSEKIAPYPYEKLALIVGATRYGGMENSSAIVFASNLFDPRVNDRMSGRFGIPTRIEDVVAHEIAHQWFGDSVTESTWADLWLSEGFATYFAGLFIEKYEGEDAFHDYMKRAAASVIGYEAQRRPPIHDTETEDLNQLLNSNNYQKGAWVLHMLRRRLGDDSFFHGLQAYYKAHHEANANTEDLRSALEAASGQDLKEFFARWVYGSGHPKYELEWGDSGKRGTVSIFVTLKQTQDGDAFLDPVPITFSVGGTQRRELIQPTGKVTTIGFNLKGMPTGFVIDPENTLLKEVVTKP